MIPNDALINILRTELDFRYKGQTDRVLLYRKRGSTKRVEVRRISMHDEQAVKILLRQAGMQADAIERFVNAYRANQH